MSNIDLKAKRPLSPHLQIYKPIFTMMMSIVHRITGVALYLGTVLVVLWLLALAGNPKSYDAVQWFFGSWIGRIILLGYTWALLHHMLGGLRHFIWDFGHGLEKGSRDWLAKATLVGSIALTIVVWVIAYAVRGL
ncbi:succinate dehydrogenase, cytochrome b556 subunit [Coralliovum pocilloporae]|uniref:succinate dehydrogenase, cytochrome b556 subunit n=1 Tax=Coralliovum pocilloporae TaxID=3066369 RepID=UPI003307925D